MFFGCHWRLAFLEDCVGKKDVHHHKYRGCFCGRSHNSSFSAVNSLTFQITFQTLKHKIVAILFILNLKRLKIRLHTTKKLEAIWVNIVLTFSENISALFLLHKDYSLINTLITTCLIVPHENLYLSLLYNNHCCFFSFKLLFSFIAFCFI